MAKNRNTFNKRKRETEKKERADEKRERKEQKKTETTPVGGKPIVIVYPDPEP